MSFPASGESGPILTFRDPVQTAAPSPRHGGDPRAGTLAGSGETRMGLCYASARAFPVSRRNTRAAHRLLPA